MRSLQLLIFSIIIVSLIPPLKVVIIDRKIMHLFKKSYVVYIKANDFAMRQLFYARFNCSIEGFFNLHLPATIYEKGMIITRELIFAKTGPGQIWRHRLRRR